MRQTQQDIKQYFSDNGLADYWKAFSNKLKPCIRIKYQLSKDDEISIGKSKLGGFPDLPQKTSWATFDNLPLSFLAQINLTELPSSDIHNLLPQGGLLSFFYSSDNDDYASSPHKVLFSDTTADLERKTRPDNWNDNEIIYGTGNVISVETEQSLPSGETEYVLDVFKEDDKNRWVYWAFVQPDNSKETTNKMFGYPHNSDDRFELICECISNGDKELTQLKIFTENQKKEIRDKWLLLLQLDSNADLKMYMGVDLDCFYFWITKDDLANKDFSKTIAFSVH
ncbi:MAG: DUF1963 domain-containing protein [Pedobacter sp.]|nr:MAG: DUF1963 domain-containing protein [Pedobacter sp.]